MKKLNIKFLLAILLPAIFAITSCKDRKCIQCKSDYSGTITTFEECYSSNKEAQQKMDAWTKDCTSVGQSYYGTYKCSCKRVESL